MQECGFSPRVLTGQGMLEVCTFPTSFEGSDRIVFEISRVNAVGAVAAVLNAVCEGLLGGAVGRCPGAIVIGLDDFRYTSEPCPGHPGRGCFCT